MQVRIERQLKPHQNRVGLALVWENGSNRIPEMIAKGEASVHPVEF